MHNPPDGVKVKSVYCLSIYTTKLAPKSTFIADLLSRNGVKISVSTQVSCFCHCRLKLINTMITSESFDPQMNADCTLSGWRQKPDVSWCWWVFLWYPFKQCFPLGPVGKEALCVHFSLFLIVCLHSTGINREQRHQRRGGNER